ncbi:MAG: hypothetical protein RL334_1535 [Chloroflexota bacterium]
MTTAELITARTFRYERWRAGAHGMLETAAQTFLLLIAVQYYAAGPTAKALLASGGSFGMLLSLLVVSVVANSGLRPARAALWQPCPHLWCFWQAASPPWRCWP